MSEPSSSPPSTSHRRNTASISTWLSLAALIVAVAAIAVAVWALLRQPGSSEYSDAQRSDAKGQICMAVDVVRRGVSLNTNMQPPGGPEDVTGALAVAANARLSLYDGGQYLLARLDPATPTDLANAVRKFANGLMDIGANATGGAQNTDPAQAARLHDTDSVNKTIQQLCK
jgi:hypothetical protein